MAQNHLEVIILAAGKGTRMVSNLPKVLHSLGGHYLLQHSINLVKQLLPPSEDNRKTVIVIGHDAEQIKNTIKEDSVHWVYQAKQKGTADAVAQAIDIIDLQADILILYGDVPCLSVTSIEQLQKSKKETGADLILLTAILDKAGNYGRIIRNSKGDIIAIVEAKDANKEQREIQEINTGVMLLSGKKLKQWLSNITNNNAQKEYYLTDIVALAVKQKAVIRHYTVTDPLEIQGVNNKMELASVERYYQQKQAKILLEKGVTLRDPSRFDLRGEVTVGKDVIIDINVILSGKNSIGNDVQIGANTVIKNTTIGDHCRIKENCVIEDTIIAAHCEIGPFARLRPQSEIAEKVKIGNFVEVKKSCIGEGSKVSHLSYIGDTLMGSNVNIGAGTITCNYDGANKHITNINDNVFIGSNTELVAPVNIAYNVTIGAGSVISADVAENQLSLSRAKQRFIADWKRPKKIIE
jgi:bifunctional UDP-N-acetylglucosamine pyrophosphorylase/glucosamine-1-phosphate N-acetyltransferase